MVIIWITELKTIKRQTCAVCGCLAARSKVPRARGLAYSIWPTGCTPALSETHDAVEKAYAACGDI